MAHPHSPMGSGGSAPVAQDYHGYSCHANPPANPQPPAYVSTAGLTDGGDGRDDIYNTRPHVKMSFEDTFRESGFVRGFPFMTPVNSGIYKWTHFVVYASIVFFIGPILSFAWAILYALIHVGIVWFVQPGIKTWFIFYRITGMMYEASVRLFLDPVFRSMALTLTAIRSYVHVKGTDINVAVKTTQVQTV